MLKPKELSPVECAKRGYINISKDTISCTHCGAVFNIFTYFSSDILNLHSSYCRLSVPIQISYDYFESFSLSSFELRLASLQNMDLLPQIIFPDSLSNNTSIFPEFPKIHLTTIYALFGWTGGYKRIHCELCGISVECSREEYGLFKTKSYYNVLTQKSCGGVRLRGNIEIGGKKSVELLRFHRYFCPWVNDITVEDFSYFSNEVESSNVGWKILLKLINKE